MRYRYFNGDREIKFELDKNDKYLLDKLAFIHLVVMKYEGLEKESLIYENENIATITIVLSFSDWDDSSNAESHCKRNLDSSGNIVKDYIGALDAADPSRNMANQMLERAESTLE